MKTKASNILFVVGIFTSIIISPILRADCTDQLMAGEAQNFIDEFVSWYEPLQKEHNLAAWAAYAGNPEEFAHAQKVKDKIDAKLSDPTVFARIKELYDQFELIQQAEPGVARQIQLIYYDYLGSQVDPKLLAAITALESEIEEIYSNYRPKVDGQEVDDNKIKETLKVSTDSIQRKKYWEASKEIGQQVAAKLLELVELRNQAAQRLGFKHFQEMQLVLDEHDPVALEKLFDELDLLTRESFLTAKTEMDAILAQRVGLTMKELRPWHYHDPFFQEAPQVYEGDLDFLYTDQKLELIAADFYRGIGFPVDEILDRSDLFPRPGKNQHAFCDDMDRHGDVRTFCNLKSDNYWMSTMLHELGHAIYFSSYIPQDLPYLLREPSHTLTTEGLAMLMGRLTYNMKWLDGMGLSPRDLEKRKKIEETAKKAQRDSLLIFSRWTQVMYRFEKALYENPKQDLNKLWWDLVEKYQGLTRPEDRNAPDYASKIHIATAPIYYHNYMAGDLWASQVHHKLAQEFSGGDPSALSYPANKQVGKFLMEKLIKFGNLKNWNKLTTYMTGAPLNAKAYAKDVQTLP